MNDTILLDGGETIFSGILSNGGAAPFDKGNDGVHLSWMSFADLL